ncbi:MAG: hypothetical protein LBT67_01705 [Holosporaceae bacterium]|jgi:hypothetical protein|nr:hypothetical protein [Holosporaceae bacterium]
MNQIAEAMNPFFSKQKQYDSYEAKSETGQFWCISADKVFSSDVDGLNDFSKFYDMDFLVKKVSLFDGEKSSDSIVCAEPVTIYMPAGRSCAMIQGYLANRKEISKIIIKKIIPLAGSWEAVEEKEFSKCIVQSFGRRGEIALFSFRYSAYSDSYVDLKKDGSKMGTAATKVDLATWEVESK